MLVITRKVQESFVLLVDGVEIAKVTALQAKGQQIRVGIEAVPAVVILREELMYEPRQPEPKHAT